MLQRHDRRVVSNFRFAREAANNRFDMSRYDAIFDKKTRPFTATRRLHFFVPVYVAVQQVDF